MYLQRDGYYQDVPCSTQLNQFVCNKQQNWRPVFLINDNITDYGSSIGNIFDYWLNGTKLIIKY